MSSSSPLDIKVVYDGSARPGERGKTVPAVPRRRVALPVIAVVNVLVASVLCYATWWPADKFIGVRVFLNTPLDVNADAAAAAMFPGLVADPSSSGVEGPPLEDPYVPPTIVGRTARIVIGATSITWLALGTIACCVLALAGGATLGHIGGSTWRWIGLILSLGAFLGLAWAAYDVWTEYGITYPLDKKRAGMAGLVLLAGLLGLAIGRAPRGLSRVAAGILILAAVGSVAGLFLGGLCGAVEPEYSSGAFLVIVFIVHSVWGWVLFLATSRMR